MESLTNIKTKGGKVSLMDIVCGWIEHASGLSASDIKVHLPNYTEAQVRGAARNLAHSGRVHRLGVGEDERYYPIVRAWP